MFFIRTIGSFLLTLIAVFAMTVIGTTAHAADGTGLQGEYFTNQDKTFAGTPTLTRVDPTVNFNWDAGSPDPSISVDHFTARWRGLVQAPASGIYTFFTSTDDGVRLWVNGQLLIDKWVDQSATEWSGSIALTAGQQYPIAMEYYENGGSASATLSWSGPSIAKQIISQSYLFPTVTDPVLTVVTVSPSTVQLHAGMTQAFSAVGTDQYGQPVSPQPTITWSASGGGAISSAGVFTAGSSTGGPFVITASAGSVAGTASATIVPDTVGVGLVAQYWTTHDKSFDGSPTLTRTDPTIDFQWGQGSPDPSISVDHFTARWTGQVQPQNTETYTFTTATDDGVRLWVNGQLLVDHWSDQGTTEWSGTIALSAGQRYDLRMDFYENGGEATARLFWSSPSTPKQIVPQSRLFPSPVLTDLAISPASVPMNVGMTQRFTVSAIDQFGTPMTPTIAWSASGSGSIDNTGLFTAGSSAGSATVTATASTAGGGLSASAAVQVLPAGSGLGLVAEYWTNSDRSFAGSPTLTRIDPTVSFDWGGGSPDPAVSTDHFTARWTGQVQAPSTETVTFYTTTDDGVRLWVNGQLLIDHWNDQGATEWSGSIDLRAGQKYAIAMQYYENAGAAVAKLAWSSPSMPKQSIPQSQLFPVVLGSVATQYTLTPASVIIHPGMTQAFTAVATDQYGQAVSPQPTPVWSVDGGGTINSSGVVSATAVGGPFTITAASSGISGIASVTVADPSIGIGLTAQYWTNQLRTFTGTPTLTRIDPTVAFDWGSGSPDPSITTDHFTARWTGQVKATASETYTFSTTTDDGVRLWVNGQLLIDQWIDQSATSWSGSIALIAGQRYDLQMDYYENGGAAVAKLFWSSPSTTQQIIPQSQLFPAFETPVLTTIAVTPASATVATGGTQAFTATARDQFGAALAIQPTIAWSVSGGGGITATGLFTAGGTAGGPFTVTASAGGIGGSASVNVTVPAAAPTFTPPAGTYGTAQSVTIASTTPGAVITYTTDGSDPSTSGTAQTASGSVQVAQSETLTAIAIASGFTPSASASATYVLQVATPTITPAGGTFGDSLTATIGCATSGAVIRFTTDGSDPTGTSPVASGNIAITQNTTVKAIAFLTGWQTSTVANAAFTIQVASPSFSVAPGTYTQAQSVVISSATSGAQIRYTTDGSTPTAGSTLASGPIAIASTTTVKAIALRAGCATSAVASAAYVIQLPQAVAPTFTPPAGTYSAVQAVVVSSTIPGAVIRYTSDGSDPITSSTAQTVMGPVFVEQSLTLRAVTTANGYQTSAGASAAYTLVTSQPTITPAGGSFSDTATATLATTTGGTTIRYTLDGSDPTASSPGGPSPLVVAITQGATITARAFLPGWATSSAASAAFSFQVATPVLSPAGGSFNGGIGVSATTTTSGAVLRYTTDGSTPTAASPVMPATITVATSGIVSVVGFRAGFADSAVATATYGITPLPLLAFTAASSSIDKAGSGGDVTIHLAQPQAQDVTVVLGIGGTAQYGSDYYLNASDSSYVYDGVTLTIPAGTTDFVLSVYPLNYGPGGSDTTILFSLSSPVNAALGDPSYHLMTIVDNSPPVVGFSSYPPTAEDVGTAMLVVSLTKPATTTVTVNYATIDNTAHSGVNYQAISGTVTFAPGQMDQSIAIPLIDDNQVDGDLLVDVSLSNPVNAQLNYSLPSYVSVTITDVDGPVTIAPGTGIFSSAFSATMSTRAHIGTIHYTIDGSDPTTTSMAYAGPIVIDHSATVTARLFRDGQPPTSSASAIYTLQAAAPYFTPGGRTYANAISVQLASVSPGVTILYTLDGTDPATGSPVANGPILIDHASVLTARSVRDGWLSSSTTAATYAFQVASPRLSQVPVPGGFTDHLSIAASCETVDAVVHYTTNGTTPTAASPVFNGPLDLTTTTTVTVVGMRDGFLPSVPVQTVFTVTPSDPTIPVIAFSAPTSAGDASVTAVVVPVILNRVSAQDVRIDYALGDGTAVPGTDVQLTPGTLIVPAGSLSSAITLTIGDHLVPEPDSTAMIQLSNPQGAILGDQSTFTYTIRNEVLPIPVVQYTTATSAGADLYGTVPNGLNIIGLTLQVTNPMSGLPTFSGIDGLLFHVHVDNVQSALSQAALSLAYVDTYGHVGLAGITPVQFGAAGGGTTSSGDPTILPPPTPTVSLQIDSASLTGVQTETVNGEEQNFTNKNSVTVHVTASVAGSGTISGIQLFSSDGQVVDATSGTATLSTSAEARLELTAVATATNNGFISSGTTDQPSILIADHVAPNLTFVVPKRYLPANLQSGSPVPLLDSYGVSYGYQNNVILLNGASEADNLLLRTNRTMKCFSASGFTVEATVDDLSGLRSDLQNSKVQLDPDSSSITLSLGTVNDGNGGNGGQLVTFSGFDGMADQGSIGYFVLDVEDRAGNHAQVIPFSVAKQTSVPLPPAPDLTTFWGYRGIYTTYESPVWSPGQHLPNNGVLELWQDSVSNSNQMLDDIFAHGLSVPLSDINANTPSIASATVIERDLFGNISSPISFEVAVRFPIDLGAYGLLSWDDNPTPYNPDSLPKLFPLNLTNDYWMGELLDDPEALHTAWQEQTAYRDSDPQNRVRDYSRPTSLVGPWTPFAESATPSSTPVLKLSGDLGVVHENAGEFLTYTSGHFDPTDTIDVDFDKYNLIFAAPIEPGPDGEDRRLAPVIYDVPSSWEAAPRTVHARIKDPALAAFQSGGSYPFNAYGLDNLTLSGDTLSGDISTYRQGAAGGGGWTAISYGAAGEALDSSGYSRDLWGIIYGNGPTHWQDLIRINNDVLATGSSSTISIKSGFLDMQFTADQFNPTGDYVHFLVDGVDYTLPIGQALQPNQSLDEVIAIRGQHFVARDAESRNVQTLVLDLDVGKNVPVGLFDVDVKLGAVHAYSDALSQTTAGANGAHRMKAALQTVTLEIVTDGGAGQDPVPADYTMAKSDALPSVALSITDTYLQSDGTGSISYQLDITDPISELVQDPTQRLQGARVYVNGVLADQIDSLQSYSITADAHSLFHPYGFHPVVNRSINLGQIKPGAYVISVETTNNPAGKNAWDSVTIPVTIERTADKVGAGSGGGGEAIITGQQLVFTEAPSSTAVDIVYFQRFDASGMTSSPLVETGPGTSIYSGTITGTNPTVPITVKLITPVAFDVGAIDQFMATITYGNTYVTTSTFAETGNNTLIFAQQGALFPGVISVSSDDNSATESASFVPTFQTPQTGQQSPAGNLEPVVVRAFGQIFDQDASHGGMNLQVSNQNKQIKDFVYSPKKYYIVRPGDDGTPVVYVLTADPATLPATFNPGLVQIADRGDVLVATMTGPEDQSLLGVQVTELDTENLGQVDTHGNPVNVTTPENLFAVFNLLEGENGMKLLQFYLDGGNTVSVENLTFGEHRLSGSTDGSMIIKIDGRINPVTAASYLWLRLDQSATYMKDRIFANLASLDASSLDADTYITHLDQNRQAGLRDAAVTAGTVANLYLGGLASLNVAADITLTMSDVSEGHYFAAVGLIPFVGQAVKSGSRFAKVIVKDLNGNVLKEFTAEQAALIRRAQAEPDLQGKMRILREAGEGVIDADLRRLLVESGTVCFVGSTKVATPTGERPISSLKVGDAIQAWDEATERTVTSAITRCYRTENQQVYTVYASNEVVECTATHPFYVVGRGWVPAIDLREGMRLTTLSGSVVAVRGPPTPSRVTTVYNIEVEGEHTYFVSKLGILVHNRCDSIGPRTLLRKQMEQGGVSIPQEIALAGKAAGRAVEAHHIFPWKFRSKFYKYGININDAQYGTWVVGGANLLQNGRLTKTHSSWSKLYNQEWDAFFRRVDNINSRRAITKTAEISPTEFKAMAEDQARTLSIDPRFDAYGNAGTSSAIGFPLNF